MRGKSLETGHHDHLEIPNGFAEKFVVFTEVCGDDQSYIEGAFPEVIQKSGGISGLDDDLDRAVFVPEFSQDGGKNVCTGTGSDGYGLTMQSSPFIERGQAELQVGQHVLHMRKEDSCSLRDLELLVQFFVQT